MKTIKAYILVFFCAIALVSCKKEEDFTLPTMNELELSSAKSIEGSWIEFTPFNEQKPKSFVLDKSGEAKSTNMINNEYKKWWVSSNNLCILSQTIDGKNDTLKYGLKAVSADIIVLEHNYNDYTYKRYTAK